MRREEDEEEEPSPGLSPGGEEDGDLRFETKINSGEDVNQEGPFWGVDSETYGVNQVRKCMISIVLHRWIMS